MTSAVKRKGESNDSPSKLSVARQQHIAVLRCLRQCLLDDTVTASSLVGLPVPDVLDIIASYSIDRSVVNRFLRSGDDWYLLAAVFGSDSIVVATHRKLLQMDLLSDEVNVLCSLTSGLPESVYTFAGEIYMTIADGTRPPHVRFIKHHGGALNEVSNIETEQPYEHRMIGIRDVLYDVNPNGVFTDALTSHTSFSINKDICAVAASCHPRDTGQDILFVICAGGRELIRICPPSSNSHSKTSVIRMLTHPVDVMACSPSGHVIVAALRDDQTEDQPGNRIYFFDPYSHSSSVDSIQLLAGLTDAAEETKGGHPTLEAEFTAIKAMIVHNTKRCLMVMECDGIWEVPLDERFFIPL